ncbi:MAG TPA: ATP-dependent protease ATPase subunit HslU [Thermomicrobiales bacterium]|nr:ATP-dependent protease ATPase subunit HslU [Thermomicrobiales bacterium]
MSELTPKMIVAELDRYVVGQEAAKRAVAVALRNRWRRQQLADDLRDEVTPRNILMLGPTGVGKTEIARRVSRIVNAPFVKVEATKFTEAGYVGRDVESMIRDLVEVAITMLHDEQIEAVRDEASNTAVQRLVDLLVDQLERRTSADAAENATDEDEVLTPAAKRRRTRRRNKLIEQLGQNALDEETVVIEVEPEDDPFLMPIEIITGVAPDDLPETLRELMRASGPRRQQRTVSVAEARRILAYEEAHRLVDLDAGVDQAVRRGEQTGVVFIDEIDKTINDGDFGPDVSGEGVQRDLLPIIEGSVVATRYGPVRTDHILFIAAGSFSSYRPSDLIPELQGRFPIRVELDSLGEDDLYAILTAPENALARQMTALLATEGVTLQLSEDGLREIAHIAAEVNARTEDIGARRLQTIVERVLEDVSFEAPERAGQSIIIDAAYVLERIGDIAAEDDLSNAIL